MFQDCCAAEARVSLADLAISAQPPQVERNPHDQPVQNNRSGDLKPDNSA